jgi:hypothetical protein
VLIFLNKWDDFSPFLIGPWMKPKCRNDKQEENKDE